MEKPKCNCKRCATMRAYRNYLKYNDSTYAKKEGKGQQV